MNLSAIILSGGRATRMNGVDKGLVALQNKPLIAHVINREIADYEAFGFPVLQDENAEFIGPLAGFLLGLKHAKHDYILTVPCDSPLLPLDLAHRLLTGMTEARADIAVARSDENTHPVFCLMKKSVLPSLTDYLDSGERKVSTWQQNQHYTEVNFDDNSEAFTNLNTFEDLAALELQLSN
jgi:molybdopterin-guanine dinucleotide biosynthesis protein A